MAVLAGVDEPRCERTDTPLMIPGLRNQGNSPARRKQQQMAQAGRSSGPPRVAPRPAALPREVVEAWRECAVQRLG